LKSGSLHLLEFSKTCPVLYRDFFTFMSSISGVSCKFLKSGVHGSNFRRYEDVKKVLVYEVVFLL
jgi:hypothetical protein